MGLDNYWLIPKNTQDNLEKFFNVEDKFDSMKPNDVEFEEASYQGEYPLNLVGGMFSGHGEGSFRGKYYAPLCDALLEGEDWLYDFHFPIDIEIAFQNMKPYLEKFQGVDAEKQWNEFVHHCKENLNIFDQHNFLDDYTLQDAVEFMKMFEYYSAVENICLHAWY
jgi:hypothetical protein